MLSAAWLGTIGFAMLGAATLRADTVFSDGTFNLTNYSLSTYQTGGATINITQILTGGDPGAALDISTAVPDGDAVRAYVVNKTFLYNPSVSGTVTSIGVSADIYRLFTGASPAQVGFSPGVYQDGNYYAYYSIFTPYAPGVYQHPSATLLQDQFNLVTDAATGATDTSLHPNFSGDPFELGFSASLASSVSQTVTGDFRYDNLRFDLASTTTTPEPSDTAMIGLGLVALLLGIKQRISRKEANL